MGLAAGFSYSAVEALTNAGEFSTMYFLSSAAFLKAKCLYDIFFSKSPKPNSLFSTELGAISSASTWE
jgi:hypothetical protein